MHRKDYLAVGGMDESFVSYGFADNDMVENCLSKGLKFIFRDELEIHLYHESFVMIDGERVPRSRFRAYTLLNGLKFCRKWKKPLTGPLLELLKVVREDQSDLLPEIDKLVALFRPI